MLAKQPSLRIFYCGYWGLFSNDVTKKAEMVVRTWEPSVMLEQNFRKSRWCASISTRTFENEKVNIFSGIISLLRSNTAPLLSEFTHQQEYNLFWCGLSVRHGPALFSDRNVQYLPQLVSFLLKQLQYSIINVVYNWFQLIKINCYCNQIGSTPCPNPTFVLYGKFLRKRLMQYCDLHELHMHWGLPLHRPLLSGSKCFWLSSISCALCY